MDRPRRAQTRLKRRRVRRVFRRKNARAKAMFGKNRACPLVGAHTQACFQTEWPSVFAIPKLVRASLSNVHNRHGGRNLTRIEDDRKFRRGLACESGDQRLTGASLSQTRWPAESYSNSSAYRPHSIAVSNWRPASSAEKCSSRRSRKNSARIDLFCFSASV